MPASQMNVDGGFDEEIGVLEGADLEGMDEEVKWLAVMFSVGGVDPPFEGAMGQERLRVEKNQANSVIAATRFCGQVDNLQSMSMPYTSAGGTSGGGVQHYMVLSTSAVHVAEIFDGSRDLQAPQGVTRQQAQAGEAAGGACVEGWGAASVGTVTM
jgi:hypothetical protein